MSPKTARQILADAKRVDKAAAYRRILANFFGNGLVTSSGEAHKRDKACVGRYFTMTHVAKYISTIQKCVDDGIERYCKRLEEQPGNVVQLFHVTTLRITGLLIGSYDYWQNPELAELCAAEVSFASTTIGEHMISGIPMWSIFPKVRRVHRARDGLCGASLRDIPIQKRKDLIANGTEDIPNDPLTAMMRDGLSEKLIGDQIMTLLCAGHDTTSYLLGYACYCLAQHQDVQAKVREEVARVVGNKDGIERNDLDQLHYMQQVIQETVRLYPVVPFVLRVTKEDVFLDETKQTIPAGTNLLIPLGHINRDPAIWEEPATFNPSRMAGVPMPSTKHGFFPFAYGERICLGNVLAVVEAKMFLVRMLQRYRITGDPNFRPKIRAGVSLVSDSIDVSLERCPLPVAGLP
eukprot:scaffold442_cov268-Pinguiococcus_pyrenoidosus.AAC.72